MVSGKLSASISLSVKASGPLQESIRAKDLGADLIEQRRQVASVPLRQVKRAKARFRLSWSDGRDHP